MLYECDLNYDFGPFTKCGLENQGSGDCSLPPTFLVCFIEVWRNFFSSWYPYPTRNNEATKTTHAHHASVCSSSQSGLKARKMPYSLGRLSSSYKPGANFCFSLNEISCKTTSLKSWLQGRRLNANQIHDFYCYLNLVLKFFSVLYLVHYLSFRYIENQRSWT